MRDLLPKVLLCWITLFQACRSLGPEDVIRDSTAPVQTTELTFQLGDDGTAYVLEIPWHLANVRSQSIFHDECGSRLEKKRGGSWVFAYAFPCPLSGIDTVTPGAMFVGTFRIHACHLQNCSPRLEVETIPGIYRIVVGLYGSATVVAGSVILADSLATNARRSNAFWLSPPR